MSTTKYCRCTLRRLSEELAAQGHQAAPGSVAELLRESGYNLHVNNKRFTGPTHPDRDEQFRNLQGWIELFSEAGVPIISVDTKKKELIGDFANAGAVWSAAGDEVNAHDFPQDAWCRATPYGIYDVLANRGHVVVGTSSDTPAFAVDAIGAWWQRQGRLRYPDADDLLILADAGGSNGCRPHLWKYALQTRLADRFGLVITVCHYPTGASKWNPVEHRLFGPISTNWAGKPLRSMEFMLNCLRGTKTTTGLRVTAEWNRRIYETGITVPPAQRKEQAIEPHATCPTWNYTIYPRHTELHN